MRCQAAEKAWDVSEKLIDTIKSQTGIVAKPNNSCDYELWCELHLQERPTDDQAEKIVTIAKSIYNYNIPQQLKPFFINLNDQNCKSTKALLICQIGIESDEETF